MSVKDAEPFDRVRNVVHFRYYKIGCPRVHMVPRHLTFIAPRNRLAMMRMSMRILVLVMCLCTTWCFGMLPRQSMGEAKGDFDIGTDDISVHADAPVMDIAVPMPRTAWVSPQTALWI